MEKNRFSTITNIFKRIFNFRAWIDFDRMRAFTIYLLTGAKKMLVPKAAPLGNEILSRKAFQEQMLRFNLTEDEIISREKGLYRLSLLMILFAFCLCIYFIYQLIYGSILAIIVTFILIFVALVMAFRYHFWYYQIKQRKLGCTIKEWYRKGLLGENE